MQTFCTGGITDFQFIYLFFNIDLKTAYLIKQQFDCYCTEKAPAGENTFEQMESERSKAILLKAAILFKILLIR